jgi:DeoR/GlpR family transcriptional regulator of sugar metabolism
MLAAERRLRIEEVLSSNRTVSALELSKSLGVATATIRRDLAVLEQEGLLVRSHGGAVSRKSSTAFQRSYDVLLRTNEQEKESIARGAQELILDGDTIFLEGSTTVFMLARLLRPFSRLSVVTNSPAIVCELQANPRISVMCTGGRLQNEIFYLHGLWTRRAVSEIRLDKAILGVSAIDPAYGVSAAGHAEAEIKQLLVKAAKQRIALADHTKFGKQSFAFVGPVTDFDIVVTDALAGQEYIQQLRDAGVKVLIAGGNGRNSG